MRLETGSPKILLTKKHVGSGNENAASTRSLENNSIPKMADKLIVLTVLLAFSSFGPLFSDKVSDLQGKRL